MTPWRSPPKTAESHTRRKNIIEVTKVQCTFDIIDYYAYLTSLSDFAVNPVLGGDLHGVIDTIFLYYVLWHGEKSRGLEFKTRVDVRCCTRLGCCRRRRRQYCITIFCHTKSAAVLVLAKCDCEL